jgi:hypothetical protein
VLDAENQGHECEHNMLGSNIELQFVHESGLRLRPAFYRCASHWRNQAITRFDSPVAGSESAMAIFREVSFQVTLAPDDCGIESKRELQLA